MIDFRIDLLKVIITLLFLSYMTSKCILVVSSCHELSCTLVFFILKCLGNVSRGRYINVFVNVFFV